MIKINLLGVPKPKSKRGGVSAPSISMGVGAGPSPALAVVIVGLLALGANGYWYWSLDSAAKTLQVRKTEAEKKRTELSEIKRSYEELVKRRDQYQRRIDVIDQLRAAQTGPVNLLSTIADTVNNTDAVWLTTMTETGSRIDLEGSALSLSAVANFIANLKSTGYFSSIEIKESYQDSRVKEMPAFNFILACQKKA